MNKFYRIYHKDGSQLAVTATKHRSGEFIVNADYYGSDGYYKAGLSHWYESTQEDFDKQMELAKTTSTVKEF